MSASYDPTLATDRDYVRLLVGDRDASSAVLQDEEIDAILANNSNKYLAAAELGDIILARTKGVVEKQVGDLVLRYGESKQSAYREHLTRLRIKGAALTWKPSVFKVL